MAGNARFHDKLHRKNHHSNPTAGFPDSAVDPIASRAEPFEGDFVINGLLSSSLGIDILSASVRGDLNAENVYVRDTTYTNFISGQGTETIISDGALTGYGDFTCTIDFQTGIYLNTPNTYITGDSYITGQLSAGTLQINTDATIQNNLQVDNSTTINIDLSVHNNATIDGNLLVRGNLSALGDVSVIETNMISTSAVTITNHAEFDAALNVHQYGPLSTIASFSYEDVSDIVVINNEGILLNSGSLRIITGDVYVGGVVVAPNITALQEASSYWDAAYQALTSNSAYWDVAYQALTSTSASWDASYYALTSTSGYWNSVYNTVSTVSSFIVHKTESSYTALTSSSSNWDTAYFVITALQDSITGAWDTTFTTVSVNSGDWDSTKSTVNARKDFWNDVCNKFFQLSGGWDDASSNFRNISSIFSTVQQASGRWDLSYSSLTSTSANWDASYVTLTSTSANWDASYSVLTSTSSNWDASFVSLTSTSANWDASYSALTSTSASWNASYSALTGASANWDAAYTSVTSNSGSWLSGNSNLDFVCNTINVLSSLSANIIHVYQAMHVSVSSFTMAPGSVLSATVQTPSYLFITVSGAGTATLRLPPTAGNTRGMMFYIKNVSTNNTNRQVSITDSTGAAIAHGGTLAGNSNSYTEVVWDGAIWQTTMNV